MNTGETPGDARPAKRSLVIAGHRTSISLEDIFWQALRAESDRRGMSLAALVREVDASRHGANLSSALRVHVLRAALAAGAERSSEREVFVRAKRERDAS